jgi:protein-L-isoaspartate O-methyltransferase
VAQHAGGLDVALLRSEIQRTYAAVSNEPDHVFMFPTGRAWAQDLGYPADLLARVPETSCESFAGVANPFSLGALRPDEHVLDIGCGAGMDTLVAAQMVGADGTVTGIDMTPAMVAKARRSVAEAVSRTSRSSRAAPRSSHSNPRASTS